MLLTISALSDFLIIFKKKRLWKPFLAFYKAYFGKNIYRLGDNLEFSKREGYTFGETPLRVWDQIATYLKKDSLLVDLGSGRGTGLMYLDQIYRINSIGFEGLYPFIAISEPLFKRLEMTGINLVHQDLWDISLPKADAIYLAGTCLSDELLTDLVQKINQARPNYIFSISTTLEEYGIWGYDIEEKQIRMPWGKTSLYILKNRSL